MPASTHPTCVVSYRFQSPCSPLDFVLAPWPEMDVGRGCGGGHPPHPPHLPILPIGPSHPSHKVGFWGETWVRSPTRTTILVLSWHFEKKNDSPFLAIALMCSVQPCPSEDVHFKCLRKKISIQKIVLFSCNTTYSNQVFERVWDNSVALSLHQPRLWPMTAQPTPSSPVFYPLVLLLLGVNVFSALTDDASPMALY